MVRSSPKIFKLAFNKLRRYVEVSPVFGKLVQADRLGRASAILISVFQILNYSEQNLQLRG
jgi:hypothetical protein